MKRNWDAQTCLARASRLTILADRADDYETILTYESLAMEWLELAARCADATGRLRPADTAAWAPRPAAPRRRKRFWFL